MGKKSHYSSRLLFHKVELTALSGLRLYPTNKHFLLQVLLFGSRCHRLSNDDHHCNLSNAFRFQSMHPSFSDSASLAESSRERSGSLCGNVFGKNGWRRCYLNLEVLFSDKEMRGRDHPTKCAKIFNHKKCKQIDFVLFFKEFGHNL